MTIKRRLLLGLAVFAIAFMGSATPAFAHATLVQSDPADGSVLDQAPDMITLTFNEPVSPDSSTVELVDVEGGSHPAEIVGHGSGDDSLQVVFGQVPDGLYSLRWTAFSASDGHVTKGMIVWGFGANADLTQASFPDANQPVPPSEVAMRWAMFAGLALALGGIVVETLVLTPLASRFSSTSDRRWNSMAVDVAVDWTKRGTGLAAGAVLLLVSHQLWTVMSQTGQSVVDTVNNSLLATTWGQWVVLRFVALLAAAIFLRGRTTLRGSRVVTLALLAAAMLSESAAGHAAGTDAALFSIINDFLHLMSAVAWIGGVFVLWRVLSLDAAERPERMTKIALSEFSPFAAAAVSVAAITGFLAIGSQISSLDALVGSAYGQTMIIKLGAVGVALVLALATRSGLSTAGPSVRIGREAVATVLIIGAAAVLTASAPANGISWIPVVRAESRQLAVVHDDIQLGVQVTPNVPGQNLVLVDAASTRRPEPAPIDRVLVRVVPLEVDVEPVTFDVDSTDRPGEYQVPTTKFSVPGRYQVQVVIRRLGLPDVSEIFDWTVASAPGARDVRFSDAAMAGPASLLGGIGALAFLAYLIGLAGSAAVRDRRIRSVERFLAKSQHADRKVDP